MFTLIERAACTPTINEESICTDIRLLERRRSARDSLDPDKADSCSDGYAACRARGASKAHDPERNIATSIRKTGKVANALRPASRDAGALRATPAQRPRCRDSPDQQCRIYIWCRKSADLAAKLTETAPIYNMI